MSRHPLYRNWKKPLAYLTGGLVLAGFLWTQSAALGIGSVLVVVVGLIVYLIGDSSDLPGTSGDGDKNVPT